MLLAGESIVDESNGRCSLLDGGPTALGLVRQCAFESAVVVQARMYSAYTEGTMVGLVVFVVTVMIQRGEIARLQTGRQDVTRGWQRDQGANAKKVCRMTFSEAGASPSRPFLPQPPRRNRRALEDNSEYSCEAIW
jgi:hypothetical protein